MTAPVRGFRQMVGGGSRGGQVIGAPEASRQLAGSVVGGFSVVVGAGSGSGSGSEVGVGAGGVGSD